MGLTGLSCEIGSVNPDLSKTVDMPTRTISLRDNNSESAYLQSRAAYKTASATFMSEPARWKEARSILRRKHADFGENQNPQFEQAFGSIAFTYLQEKAPGLVPYILGFQLLDRSDEGKKAVGVFVAEIGDKKIDIPMFFINGELKGHQVMRLRNPEMFLPLRESFLDYLFSKIPQDLGEAGVSLNSGSPVQSTPDIQPFSGSRYVKGAAEEWMHDWAVKAGVAEEYAAIRYNPVNLELGISLLEKKKNAHVNLLDFLSQPTSKNYLKTAAVLCDRYPAFLKSMNNTLGEGWLKTAATKAFAPQPTKSAITVAPQRGTVRLNFKTAAAIPDLSFTKRQMGIKIAGVMHDEIAAEIDKYGEHAIDNRSQDKLAKAYEVEDQSFTVESPEMPGIYDVMDVEGKRKQMVVIPTMNRTTGSQFDLIIDPKSKRFCNVDRNRYVAYSLKGDFDNDAMSKAIKPNSRRPDEGDIFFIWLKNQMAGPFYATKRISADRFDVQDISTDYLVNNKEEGHSYPPIYCSDDANISSIVFAESSHDSGTSGGRHGTFTVPKDTRVYVLGNWKSDGYGETASTDYFSEGSSAKQFRLDVYDRAEIRLFELGKLANLEVMRKASGYVELNKVEMKPGQARHYLMATVGLGKESAERIVNGPMHTVRYIVQPAGKKFASLSDIKKLGYYQPSVEFPTTQDPYSSESGQYSIESPEQLYTQDAPEPTRDPIEPWEDPQGAGNPSLAPAEQQAMSQDPTDTMSDMVGLISILRNSRVDSEIKATTKALLTAVSRLGRQIIVFHAHRDEFEELYGEGDIDDLEAALSSTFEQGGDLFITLTRRSSNDNPELDIADLPTE